MNFSSVIIEPAKEEDFPAIWQIFQQVISTGDTYVNNAKTSKEQAYQKWMNKDAKTFVAKHNGKVVGAYLIKPNQVDHGSHTSKLNFNYANTES
jgi:L-amino acid N-acyltransferase YncA